MAAAGYTSSATMAGFTPATDVSDHAMIDLDMTAINNAMGDGDYATANDIYNNGANSVKGTGYRTLAGFSKSVLRPLATPSRNDGHKHGPTNFAVFA